MNWDWVWDNLSTIISVVSALAVLATWLYLRYSQGREQLRRDLEKLLADGLEFLKGWAGDELADVTEAEVAEIADWFYHRYAIGSVLEKFVTKEQLRALFWKVFSEWRDRFITANAFLARK